GRGGGNGGSGGSGGGATLSLTLPQALDGALWADPAVYATLPLRITVGDGSAQSVSVAIGGMSVTAVDQGGGAWLATIPASGLADGLQPLDVTATASGASGVAHATLGIGRAGAQLTSFASVGVAQSPSLLRDLDGAPGRWLAWTDRSMAQQKAWLSRLDGAGRFQGARTLLVDGGAADEILYARVVKGAAGTLGVLYQTHGGPYKNWFKIVGSDGSEKHVAIALDPASMYGSFGGDLSFDGSGYVFVWRSNDGAGHSTVYWMRVDETSGATVGPIVVAKTGAGTAADPIGGIDPISFVKLQTAGDLSTVAFVRGRWDAIAAAAVPKSELVLVEADGTVTMSTLADRAHDELWHGESRVYKVGADVVAVWTAKDLNDPADNPSNVVYGGKLSSTGAMSPGGAGASLVAAVDDRDEPFLIAHPEHYGVLAWLDHRTYTTDPNNGRIQLYVAPVAADLSTSHEVVFPHARFVAGTSDLMETTAGSNVILLWVDERHGNGIADPKPELYFETAWF
ncbi:MAG: hypothetical protein ACXVDD_29360, partial [Polyangia bacterium]